MYSLKVKASSFQLKAGSTRLSRPGSSTTGKAGRIAAALCLMVLASARFSKAQGANSTSVSGTILDPSGAAVPNATVTMENPVSGFERRRHRRFGKL